MSCKPLSVVPNTIKIGSFESLIFSDSGLFQNFAFLLVKIFNPSQFDKTDEMISGRGGSIGWGVGATLGAKCASGDRNVALGTFTAANRYGDDNISISTFGAGYGASGTKNIYIGYAAGYEVRPGSNNVDINALASAATSDMDGLYKKLNIQDTIRGDGGGNRIVIGGNLGAADYSPDATLEVKPKEATDVGIIVQADASHSANLMEFQNNSEFVLA